MAIAKTSLGVVVKDIDQVIKALRALKGEATSTELKLLNAKIKKLDALRIATVSLCPKGSHSLNANPLGEGFQEIEEVTVSLTAATP